LYAHGALNAICGLDVGSEQNWQSYYKGIGLLCLITTSAIPSSFAGSEWPMLLLSPYFLGVMPFHHGRTSWKNQGINFLRNFVVKRIAGIKIKKNCFLAWNVQDIKK